LEKFRRVVPKQIFGLFQALTTNFLQLTDTMRVIIFKLTLYLNYFFGDSRFQDFKKLLKNSFLQNFYVGFLHLKNLGRLCRLCFKFLYLQFMSQRFFF
jgi:hypothetical protein